MSKICPTCGKTHEAVKFCPYCDTKVPELDPDSTRDSKQGNISYEKFNIRDLHPIALFLVFVVLGLLIIEMVLDIINGNLTYAGAKSFPIISLGIGYICGEYAASNWAPKIQGSKSWAFIIPFFTNLLGLACYWAYYRYKVGK